MNKYYEKSFRAENYIAKEHNLKEFYMHKFSAVNNFLNYEEQQSAEQSNAILKRVQNTLTGTRALMKKSRKNIIQKQKTERHIDDQTQNGHCNTCFFELPCGTQEDNIQKQRISRPNLKVKKVQEPEKYTRPKATEVDFKAHWPESVQ